MSCVRLGVVELVGYREWTETLGHDREWRIQETQARLYAGLQDAAKEVEAYVIPLRMDYMVLLAENVTRLDPLLEVLRSEAPVPFRIALAKAGSPREAEGESTRRLLMAGHGEVVEHQLCRGEEVSTIAHIDVNDISSTLSRDGVTVYESYVKVVSLYSSLQRRLSPRGALVSYLGGDNIIAVLPPSGEEGLRPIISDDLKAGIGVAETPRRALGLATLALDTIRREGRKKGRVLLLKEGANGPKDE